MKKTKISELYAYSLSVAYVDTAINSIIAAADELFDVDPSLTQELSQLGQKLAGLQEAIIYKNETVSEDLEDSCHE